MANMSQIGGLFNSLGLQQEQKINPLPAKKPNAFTKIGKTLTAVSLGLQGKDPSSVFEDDQGINFNEVLQRAQVAEMVQPGSGREILLGAVGGVQSPTSLPQPKQPSAIQAPNQDLIITGGTQKTLGGTQTFTSLPGKKAESEIAVEQQVSAQSEKAAEEARRDFNRARAALDTNLDQFFSFGTRQQELFGLNPGDYLGIVDKLVPEQLNEFKKAFEGSAVEGAALIATQIIPSTRAAKITKIFEGSVGKPGSTTEGTINNITASAQNAFANAISQNVKVFDEETGKEVPIQETLVDPKTGKKLSKLGLNEQARAISDIKREFSDNLRNYYIAEGLKRNPSLFKKETIQEFAKSLPNFESEEQLNEAGLTPGTVIMLNGQIGVFR